MNSRVCVVAAGGTGGHMFPAEALAREMAARGWRVVLATDRRGEQYAANFPAEEKLYLDAATGSGPVALLKAGGTIGMSPEGTRSRTGGLIRARSGVAWLALRANTAVVPVAIWGVENIHRELGRLRRAAVHARVGPAIVFDPNLTAEAATEVAPVRSTPSSSSRASENVSPRVNLKVT